MSDSKKPKPQKELDLSHIKTPQELLGFIQEMREGIDELPPCKCGLTLKEFDKTGRFGCEHCYEHFQQRMEELVYPFHQGNRTHVGKQPKGLHRRQMENDPAEKLKFLKLKYAKALELEEYEKCADLKKEIDELSQSLSSTSGDQ